jgi:hypothetical protein
LPAEVTTVAIAATPATLRPSAEAAPASEAPLSPFTSTTATVTLVEIRRHSYATPERQGSLSFLVSLGRPDRGIDQPDNEAGDKLTSDLPEALRPELFYVSLPSDTAPDHGSMCDRPRFPHRCELDSLTSEQVAKREASLLLKLTFADGTYTAVPITVPLPPPLSLPEIVAPAAPVAQGSPLALAFRDVSAQSYVVRVENCDHYQNDGINPCLDQQTFTIEHGRGAPVLLPISPERTATVAANDGLILLRAPMALRFEESLGLSIEARRTGKLRGVRTVVAAHASRVIPR